MKIKTIGICLLLCLLLLAIPIKNASAAPLSAYCTGSGCNWLDPEDTDCWSTAYVAGAAYYGANDELYNYNMYTSTCIANWSRTGYITPTWLAAETLGVHTYDGTQPWAWVWNNMWDGSGTVCTKGYVGNSYQDYYGYTAYTCR